MSTDDLDTRIRDSFARQGLMAHLGAELTHVADGEVTIELPFRDELTQQHGFFHAGSTTSICDSACGYAALTTMPPGAEVLSIEFKINLMAPAAGARLIARGTVVRAGRTIVVCQGDVYAVKDGVEKHCAAMIATMMCMMPRD
ncbi:MAG: PaaI family thioesterase [Mobilicoccus sp.]|nr:PaaI family thioesterase [Mobilicoccus sp.]